MKPIFQHPALRRAFAKANGCWLAAALILIATIATPAAESLSVLLQKAIFAEETEGNLDAAIKIYEGITKESDANRSLVAQAQYRLGLCHVKQGKKSEAVAAFRKLIEQFPKENELIAKTRDRLSELGQAISSVVVRQVWSSAMDTGGSISRDGRMLSFVDWDTGDIAVRDLRNAENRRLTDKGSWEKSSEFSEYSVFAPDGRQLAYNWFDGKQYYELWRISVDNPRDRVRLVAKVDWVWPLDWSPDGESILAEITRERENELALISARDGTTKTLKPLGREEPDSARFSPDGRYVAYNLAPASGGESDIFLIELSTGREIPLVTHPADDRAPIWTPDGTALLFTSDRRATVDLWMVPIADGKITREPVLVKPAFADASPIGFTQSGAFHYGLFSRSSSLYVTSLDLETGQLLAAPKQVPFRFSGGQRSRWNLSPNGRFLFYKAAGRRPQQNRISYVDLESGQERDLTNLPPLRWDQNAGGWWRTDEKLFLWGKTMDQRDSWSLFDRVTGQLQTITTDAPKPNARYFSADFIDGAFHYLRWNPPAPEVYEVWHDPNTNQKREAVVFNEPNPKAQIGIRYNRVRKFIERTESVRGETGTVSVATLRDMAAGKGFELFRSAQGRLNFCSPMHETNRVAISGFSTNGPIVKVFDITGERPVERLSVQLPRYSNVHPGWDGKRRLLFTKRIGDLSEEQTVELWTLSADTGEMKKMNLAMQRMNVVARHPDGKQIFIEKSDKPLSEVWMMEDFLPQMARSK